MGGQLLASGIGKLGEGISGGISTGFEQARKAQEEQSANQLIIDYAIKNNLITPEQHTQYLNGSASTKNGVVAGLTRTLAMDMQRKNAEDQRREQLARTNLLTAQAASKFAGPDSREGTPQPLTLPDGTVIPGHYYVPGARRVISTQPQLPLGAELGEFVWNGKQLVKKPSADAQGPEARFMEVARRSNLDNILRQIGEVQGEISTGNQRPGPDWLPGFTTPYSDQLRKLEARRNALTDAPATAAAPSGPAGEQTTLSPQDQQALTWARSNSDDPRAAKVLARLGLGSGTVAPTQGVRQPQIGERRTVNGVPAVWDGTGWVAAQ